MRDSIPIFVGYDERERVGYPVFCQSVLARTRARVSFHPVRGEKVHGSTKFNPERFKVAEDCGYSGWAIWAECDMLCLADVEELVALADSYMGVLVAKHEYKTKHPVKFLGQPNPDYERKNWSSLMLINCRSAGWQRLGTTTHNPKNGHPWTLEDLHRFRFLDEDRIGALPLEWNHLVGEYEPNPGAKLAHFTVGLPIWPEYAGCEFSDAWRAERESMLHFDGRGNGTLAKVHVQGAPFTSEHVRPILDELARL